MWSIDPQRSPLIGMQWPGLRRGRSGGSPRHDGSPCFCWPHARDRPELADLAAAAG
jgi:hypothetical protein